MTTNSITAQPTGNFDWDTLTLAEGSHDNGETDGCGSPLLCFMEAFNVSRGQRVTDACPADVSLTLHGFIIGLNDAFGTADRQRLKRYRDQIIGTGSQPDADERAAYMCVDWLIRTYTPAFLRLAGLDQHADALASAGEVVDLATLGQVTDRISAADSVACSVARSAADSPGDWAASLSADWAALSAADLAAYLTAGSVAYLAATRAAASVASSVASSAATLVAEQMLAPTVAALQASAFGLLDRMIAAYTVAAA